MFISEVVRGGAAELDGRLMQGDQILSVNGDDTTHSSQESVAAVLKVHTHTEPGSVLVHSQLAVIFLSDHKGAAVSQQMISFPVCVSVQCVRKSVVLELGRLKAASWISSRLDSHGSQVGQRSQGLQGPHTVQATTTSATGGGEGEAGGEMVIKHWVFLCQMSHYSSSESAAPPVMPPLVTPPPDNPNLNNNNGEPEPSSDVTSCSDNTGQSSTSCLSTVVLVVHSVLA